MILASPLNLKLLITQVAQEHRQVKILIQEVRTIIEKNVIMNTPNLETVVVVVVGEDQKAKMILGMANLFL